MHVHDETIASEMITVADGKLLGGIIPVASNTGPVL